jgi:hypothetical protein
MIPSLEERKAMMIEPVTVWCLRDRRGIIMPCACGETRHQAEEMRKRTIEFQSKPRPVVDGEKMNYPPEYLIIQDGRRMYPVHPMDLDGEFVLMRWSRNFMALDIIPERSAT